MWFIHNKVVITMVAMEIVKWSALLFSSLLEISPPTSYGPPLFLVEVSLQPRHMGYAFSFPLLSFYSWLNFFTKIKSFSVMSPISYIYLVSSPQTYSSCLSYKCLIFTSFSSLFLNTHGSNVHTSIVHSFPYQDSTRKFI